MKISKTPPITLREFERISQIILAIIEVENGDKTKNCITFAAMGSHMLRQIFKLDAKIILGNAFYVLPNSCTLAYYDTPTTTGFHCWIEANGWLFDFSSIAFPEITHSLGFPACERFMLQKPLSQMALSIPEDESVFAFHVIPEHSNRTPIERFINKQGFRDLCAIAVQWYKKPPRPIPNKMLIGGYGEGEKAAIITKQLKGVW